MSSDSDKTQFLRPGADGDRTVFRPSPGGRKKSTSESPSANQPVPPVQPPVSPLSPEPISIANSGGINPLVAAASTLLAVFEKTKSAMSHTDVGALHRSLASEIKHFETEVVHKGYPREIVLSSRYLICSALDEAVLNTPWGSESPWSRRTLLSIFYNETSGGEKSFTILERLRERPAENRDILELFYICLSLGFEGKYRLMARGRDALDQLCDELFRTIRNHRGENERILSPSWQGVGKVKSTLSDFVPMWVVVVCALVIIVLGYSGFRYWLYESSSAVVSQLTEISQVAPPSESNKQP